MARNAHPEVTERRILEAARELFTEKGYEKTSIQNIVDRLGNLSKGAIYHHFTSKEAILDKLNDTDWDYSQAARDRIMARTDLNGLEKMRELFKVTIDNKDHRKLNEVTIPLLDDPTTLASSLNFWAAELPKHWLPIIEEGMRDGSIPTEYPQEAAELISLLANYWLLTRFCPPTRAELRHRIQCLATMLNAINVPVFDDELIRQTCDFYAQLNAQNPEQTPHD
ncbi:MULTISPECIES: TetR/AcrR family transcriptional regulator [Bifidobacterium]|uniref:TetR family transcriptional regulator n=2 Tax=Bifidobacterium TaxID=1678 RepID=A0A2M9HNH6_9BIFI|nr:MULTISPECIES: TetR/AcrR family transcriptional regulator [Bifidobacterium]NMM98476.1 AcrR family transcriptional regulator [Bifidobacterium sp. DSM 109959]PJM78355.1 TetR family transcriptional regulator [Bifidobacterium scaligerum]